MATNPKKSYHLPCHPCPYGSLCCSWGSSLSDDERLDLTFRYGKGVVVWDDEEQEYRTSTENGRCVFLTGSGCRIHDDPAYPAVCREFPWRDGDGTSPYQYDVSICPEMVGRPEALALPAADGTHQKD